MGDHFFALASTSGRGSPAKRVFRLGLAQDRLDEGPVGAQGGAQSLGVADDETAVASDRRMLGRGRSIDQGVFDGHALVLYGAPGDAVER